MSDDKETEYLSSQGADGIFAGIFLAPVLFTCFYIGHAFYTGSLEEPKKPAKEPTQIERVLEEYDKDNIGDLNKEELANLLNDYKITQ